MPRNTPSILKDLECRHQAHTNKNTKSTGAILAIDYGTKFSGLAYSPDGICVFPVKVVATEILEATINTQIHEKNIKLIVFGMPVSGDGKEVEPCPTIRTFAKKWQGKYALKFVNERYSSQQAKQVDSKSTRIDDLAAVKILEFYLERQAPCTT